MYREILKKALIISVTALFLELWLTFLRGINNISRIIPLVDTIMRKNLSASDFFLLMSIWLFYIIFRYYKIKPAEELRRFCSLFSDFKTDMGIVVLITLPSHFLFFPLLREIFEEPIRDIQNAPDSIRHTIAVSLPALWLLIVALINKSGNGNNGPYNASKSVQKQSKKGTDVLPPPPP